MTYNYTKIEEEVLRQGKKLLKHAGMAKEEGKHNKWRTEFDGEVENNLKAAILLTDSSKDIFFAEVPSNILTKKSAWVIDAISHVYNFIHGMPHYAIVVSHFVDGIVNYACVYDPSTEEFFQAQKGKGAFLNGKAISVNSELKKLTILYDYYALVASQQLIAYTLLQELNDKGRVKAFGSLALHYAYVACGRASVAVSRNQDTLTEFAGKLLVEEAGGMFTDFKGKELVHDTWGVLATNGKVHKEFVRILQRH